MKLPEGLTVEEVLEAAQESMFGPSLENPGFCLSCGNRQDGCEPDARNYECEECGKKQVFGAQEIILMIA